MRIAIVHSYYSDGTPSGENIAVDNQADALVRAGHEVRVVAQRTSHREHARLYPIEAAFTVATGLGRSPAGALREFRPHVVHVHNLFPNWGTRWVLDWPGPLVATLHNYRSLCAAGTLYREGSTCTLCPEGQWWSSARYRCYRGSVLATTPLMLALHGGVVEQPLVRRADRLVVLAERARSVFAQYGVPQGRMTTVNNFVSGAPDLAGADRRRNGKWLFVGRLTREKGVIELIENWPAQEELDLVGDGPLRGEILGDLPANIRLLGSTPRRDLLARMPDYHGLVFPSRWFEGQPMAVLEALAVGLPVIARAGSSAADLVETTGAGFVAATDQEWRLAVESVLAARDALSRAALKAHQECFSESVWLSRIEEVYERAIEERRQ